VKRVWCERELLLTVQKYTPQGHVANMDFMIDYPLYIWRQ